jgi:hypothetical protein
LIWVACACLLWACGDDGPPRNQIITGGGNASADATDASDAVNDGNPDTAADVVMDPACTGIEEGGSCSLPNAVGVCVRGECRFLGCESGFRSCDATVENGCEADVTTVERCGTCSNRCPDEAACQLSGVGYICSKTPVCRDGRIDLDGQLSNGCEYRIQDVGTFLARPGDIDASAGDLLDNTFWYAGATSEGPVVGATDSDQAPVAIASAADSGPAVAVVADASRGDVSTVWRGGVSSTTSPQSSADDPFVRPECLGPLDEHTLTGIDPVGGKIVSARHGLFSQTIDGECTADACLLPVFDRIDYLRAYYPYEAPSAPAVASDPSFALPESALSGCDTCFMDSSTGQLTTERDCLGDTVCAQTPVGDCVSCEPSLDACPDFAPIFVRGTETGDTLVVATRTGVLLLTRDSQAWRGGPRAEDFLGDTRIVAADVALSNDVATAFLLGDDERIYVVRIDLEADSAIAVERAPIDAVIPVDLASAALHAATEHELLLSSRSGAVLIRSTSRGSVQAPIPAPETAIDARELVASGYDGAGRRYGLLYSSLGQFTLRTVAFAPISDDEAQ